MTTHTDADELARELLPCPFCGQAAVRMIDLSTDPKTHSYRCDNDDCDVRPTTCQKTSALVARRIWNTRTASPATAWRDIASAPKDGSRILICGGTITFANETFPTPYAFTGVGIAQYHANSDYPPWRGEHTETYDEWEWHEPTHWQPLPAPPQTWRE